MTPLTYAGIGWLLLVLGTSLGGLITVIAPIGAAAVVVGLMRIRWRDSSLNATFWSTAALVIALVVLVTGVHRSLLLTLVAVLLQAGVGVGLATGAHDCLGASRDQAVARLGERLQLVRTLVIVTTGGTVLAYALAGAGLDAPVFSMLLLFIATLAVNIWLGVLLLQLRQHPALQEHSSPRR